MKLFKTPFINLSEFSPPKINANFENFSINEIVDMFGAEKKYIPARKGEYPFTLCDYSKAKKLLNWIPTKNLKGYIENAKSILKSS